MPIKKSSLEQKMSYRITKVFLLILPLLFLVFIVLKEKMENPFLDIFSILGENIVYVAVGSVAYYIILKIAWKIYFYIAFGGLEDDIKKKIEVVTQPVGSVAQSAPQPSSTQDNSLGILFIIIIIVFIISYFVYGASTQTSTSTRTSSGGGKNSAQVFCNPGDTYNYSSGKCCPNSVPHYYPGTHGISSPGCYASCPYLGDCSNRTTRY